LFKRSHKKLASLQSLRGR